LSDTRYSFVSRPNASNNAHGAPESLDAPISPLVRLRQIAEELRAAARRNDLEVVRAAANLLLPTVEQCKLVTDRTSAAAGDTARIVLQIQDLLDESETILEAAMRGVGIEMKRIRQGKRSLAMVRSRQTARPVQILNAIR
jgi:hypothetical protein